MKKIVLPLLLISALAIQAQDPKGLQVNDAAPDFNAVDQNNKSFHLKSALKKGPVVLIFYRGEWCPYCNRQLKGLEDSIALIKERGATLVAVTPQKPEYIAKTIEKTNASYPVIHDDGLKIMNKYAVSFAVPDDLIEKYKKYKLDFVVINGEVNGANLPVPALYIIKDGVITYRYFDPNYRKRPSVQDILNNLPKS